MSKKERLCRFSYYYSDEINLYIKIQIQHLVNIQRDASTLRVCAQLLCYGDVPMHGSDLCSTMLPISTFPYACWDQWLMLPVKYRDISPDAAIVFTLQSLDKWGAEGEYLGTASMRLFDPITRRLRCGQQKLGVIWNDHEVSTPQDTSLRKPDTLASSNLEGDNNTDDVMFHFNKRVERETKKDANVNGETTQRSDWLTQVSLGQIENIRHQQFVSEARMELLACNDINVKMHLPGHTHASPLPENSFLYVNLPSFQHPVLARSRAPDKFVGQRRRINDQWLEQMDPNTGKKYYVNVRTRKMQWQHPFPNMFQARTFVSTETSGSKQQQYQQQMALQQNLMWLRRMDVVADPEMKRENPIAQKNLKLFRRDLESEKGAAPLKPTEETLRKLKKIIKSPRAKADMSEEDKQLLWHFRGFLTSDAAALVKFLYVVDRSDTTEVEEALRLLGKWAEIGVPEALVMLSNEFTHDVSKGTMGQIANPLVYHVRRHAVAALRRCATNEDYMAYLLQLVQALRYEPELRENSVQKNAYAEEEEELGSPLARLLIEKAVADDTLANFFYWYIHVETLHDRDGLMFSKVLGVFHDSLFRAGKDSMLGTFVLQQELMGKLEKLGAEEQAKGGSADSRKKRMRELLSPDGPYGGMVEEAIPLPCDPKRSVKAIISESILVMQSALKPFVIEFVLSDDATTLSNETTGASAAAAVASAATASTAATQLTPMIDGDDDDEGYAEGGGEVMLRRCAVRSCQEFFKHCKCDRCMECGTTITSAATSAALMQKLTSERRKRRSRRNKNKVEERHHCRMCGSPLCSACWNKSTKQCRNTVSCIRFRSRTARIMFKVGDDLRQDQLILQLICLMDRLLKRRRLDLKLTLFNVLATTFTNGMLEFVPNSLPLSKVANIGQWLKEKHPATDAASGRDSMGIQPDILQNFVKSCAGYAVITYILGVGDRHLDNILINATTGCIFHIDFGYIFGRDPKFNVPQMRLTKGMAEAMGGQTSRHWLKFKEYCGIAFNILRQSQSLILNLLRLMADAGLEAVEPNDMLVVQDRFLPDNTDEEAERLLMEIIDVSLNHKWVNILEGLHAIASAMR